MQEHQMQSALRKGRFATHDESRDDGESKNFSSPGKHVTVPLVLPTIHKIPSTPISNTRKKTSLAIKGYGRSGTIQSRTTIASLLLQKWTASHWLHVYPATIKIFDTKEKMTEWKALNNAANNNNNGALKSKLVQKSLNFDTQGKLQRKIDIYEAERGEGKDTNAKCNQVISGIRHYAMEEVRSKFYKKNSPLMHTCKVSYSSNTGRNIVAAFGTLDPAELKRIRSIIRYCIRLVRKASKPSRMPLSHPGDDASGFSGMTIGALSAVSATQYGEVTMTAKTKQTWSRRKGRRARSHFCGYKSDGESIFSGASKSTGIAGDDYPSAMTPSSGHRAQSWVRGD
jgi:hypothetical protein